MNFVSLEWLSREKKYLMQSQKSPLVYTFPNYLMFTFVSKIYLAITLFPCNFAKIILQYTQYPIIRNGHIRHAAEISENFKKPLFNGSNLRNAHWSPFLV